VNLLTAAFADSMVTMVRWVGLFNSAIAQGIGLFVFGVRLRHKSCVSEVVERTIYEEHFHPNREIR
jgi:hypothetical protein